MFSVRLRLFVSVSEDDAFPGSNSLLLERSRIQTQPEMMISAFLHTDSPHMPRSQPALRRTHGILFAIELRRHDLILAHPLHHLPVLRMSPMFNRRHHLLTRQPTHEHSRKTLPHRQPARTIALRVDSRGCAQVIRLQKPCRKILRRRNHLHLRNRSRGAQPQQQRNSRPAKFLRHVSSIGFTNPQIKIKASTLAHRNRTTASAQ